MILLHCREGSPPWHPRYRQAFMQGFAEHGEQVGYTPMDRIEPDRKDDVHVLFGPNYWSNTYADGERLPSRTLCIDRCSVGNANDFVTIGWDGWGGHGTYPTPTKEQLDGRWQKWADLMPPTVEADVKGDHVIVIGEYPSACDNKPTISRFYNSIVSSHAPGTVLFRPHPHFGGVPKGMTKDTGNHALLTARSVLTYKSSFGVTCRLMGLPVSAGKASLAGRDFLGGEESWKKWLLFTQWHIDEICSGEFWEYLKDA